MPGFLGGEFLYGSKAVTRTEERKKRKASEKEEVEENDRDVAKTGETGIVYPKRLRKHQLFVDPSVVLRIDHHN